MKRLLLSLCLVGAAFPGHTPSLLQTTQPSTASAPLLVGARAPPAISPGGLKAQGMAGSNHSEQMVGRSVAMVRHDTETTLARAEEQRAPLPPTGDRTEPSVAPVPEDEKEEAIWAVSALGDGTFRSFSFCSYGSLLSRWHRIAGGRLSGWLVSSLRRRNLAAWLDLREVLSSANSWSWADDRSGVRLV